MQLGMAFSSGHSYKNLLGHMASKTIYQICLNLLIISSYKQPNAPGRYSLFHRDLMGNNMPKVTALVYCDTEASSKQRVGRGGRMGREVVTQLHACSVTSLADLL